MQVWPGEVDGVEVVLVSLSSPDGHAVLEARRGRPAGLPRPHPRPRARRGREPPRPRRRRARRAPGPRCLARDPATARRGGRHPGDGVAPSSRQPPARPRALLHPPAPHQLLDDRAPGRHRGQPTRARAVPGAPVRAPHAPRAQSPRPGARPSREGRELARGATGRRACRRPRLPGGRRGLTWWAIQGFEPVTSSVSRKRATTAPIARAAPRCCREVETGFEPVYTALQAVASPLGHSTEEAPPRDLNGALRADDGIRTRDPHLGKVMLYH